MRRYQRILAALEGLAHLPSAADRDPSLLYKRLISVNIAYPRKKPPACRRCNGKLPEGRTAWCSDVCTEDALIRCSASYAARYVRWRDKGICAECGLNVTSLMKAYRAVRKPKWGKPAIEVDNLLIALGFRPGHRGWEANHIVPVYQGGGHCTINNYETLCCNCHKRRTSLQATERALAKAAKNK